MAILSEERLREIRRLHGYEHTKMDCSACDLLAAYDEALKKQEAATAIGARQADANQNLAAQLRKTEAELTEALKKQERLREALEQAGNDICSEYCGFKHHACCIAVTAALVEKP